MAFLDNICSLLPYNRLQKQRQIRLCNQLINEASDCISFSQLLTCHQHIFSEGIPIDNLDATPNGMFREAASQLTLDKVYLGNICGLFIKTARYWESSKDYVARDICIRQWQNALISNLAAYAKTLDANT